MIWDMNVHVTAVHTFLSLTILAYKIAQYNLFHTAWRQSFSLSNLKISLK